jgi:aspartate/methionine/tyrosine aminotransferase
MFDARKRMDPYYAGLTSRGGAFAFQMKLNRQPVAMNWADPFRPDDTVPPHVKKAVIECLNSNAAHYTYPIGDQILREELAKRIKKINDLDVDPNEHITVCSGSDTAFIFSMRPFINPGAGDEVLISTPTYANDYDVAPLCGGKTVLVPGKMEHNYALDMDEFEKRVSNRTKMVLITNPNNPTGTVYTRKNMEELADFVKRHNLILVTDQCFEDIVYGGREMVTVAALPDMFERTILISSLSKGMGLCGFRVGYIVADSEITDVLHATAVQFLGAPNTMAQAGIVAALKDPSFMEEQWTEYNIRVKLIAEILDQIPHIRYPMPEGGFYFWIDVSHYGTSNEIVRYLVEEASVLVSPGDGFGSDSCIRLIFAALADREECLNAVRSIRDAFLKHPHK